MKHAPDSSGVYLFVFDVRRDFRGRIGALGVVELPAGRYGYVGSAQRGLEARIARHARRRKRLHWHIDALARCARPVGAVVWPWRAGRECRLAQAVVDSATGRRAIPRFGASDCGCGGHLFALAEEDVERLAAGITAQLGVAPIRFPCFRSLAAARREGTHDTRL